MRCSLICLVLGLVLAGCGGGTGASSPSPSAAPSGKASASPLAQASPRPDGTPAKAKPDPSKEKKGQAMAPPRAEKKPITRRPRPQASDHEGDGGDFQGKKSTLAAKKRRGASNKPDRRMVDAVLGKQRAISDTIQSRTFVLGIQLLLEQARYDELERLGDYYATHADTVATGQRKSTIFYYALKTPRVEAQAGWLLTRLLEWHSVRPNSPHVRLALARVLMEAEEGRWKANPGAEDSEIAQKMLREPLVQARHLLQEAVKLSPPSPDTYALLIDCLRRGGGSAEEAEGYLAAADELDPGNYHVESQYARLLHSRRKDWRAAFSKPENAHFALESYLEKVKASPKDWLEYAQAAEKVFPKSALIKNRIAHEAFKARDYELAAKKFAELGDRPEIYVWKTPSEFYEARNKLEDQGYKVRTGAFFPLPEVPEEIRAVKWEDDLLVMQAAELFAREHYAELDAVAETFRAKDARTERYERKVALLYGGFQDEYYNDRMTAWERSVMGERWRKLKPSSVMAKTVSEMAAIEEAWDIRGGGYADSVSDSQWEGFRERLETAYGYFEEIRASAGAKDVEAYAKAITTGMGLSLERPQVEGILAEARQIDKGAPEPYAAMAQYLLPRWHGTEQEYVEFLASVPAECMPYVAVSQSDDLDLTSSVWRQKMLRGDLAIAAKHSTVKTWTKVLYMAIAADDRETGRKALAALQGRWSPDYVPTPKVFKKMVAWSQGAPFE